MFFSFSFFFHSQSNLYSQHFYNHQSSSVHNPLLRIITTQKDQPTTNNHLLTTTQFPFQPHNHTPPRRVREIRQGETQRNDPRPPPGAAADLLARERDTRTHTYECTYACTYMLTRTRIDLYESAAAPPVCLPLWIYLCPVVRYYSAGEGFCCT